jgi:hypothetical protein
VRANATLSDTASEFDVNISMMTMVSTSCATCVCMRVLGRVQVVAAFEVMEGRKNEEMQRVRLKNITLRWEVLSHFTFFL